MKLIIVTGAVGTGKTTLAKKLAGKLNYEYIDVNKIIKKYKISEGYDKKRKTKVIDIKKLNKYLIKEILDIKTSNNKSINKKLPIKKSNIKKTLLLKNKTNKKLKIKNGLVIDSHLSHYLPKRYVDLCIVTKCNLKTLEKRLKKRGYSKGKIRENLDCEIFDTCFSEAKEKGHEVIALDTGRKINMKEIIKQINGLC